MPNFAHSVAATLLSFSLAVWTAWAIVALPGSWSITVDRFPGHVKFIIRTGDARTPLREEKSFDIDPRAIGNRSTLPSASKAVQPRHRIA